MIFNVTLEVIERNEYSPSRFRGHGEADQMGKCRLSEKDDDKFES